MLAAIDLNADLGEGYGPWRMGDDSAMLKIVSSASIACGGHAGDPETMFATLRLAGEAGVAVGAHPSFADREGFGRRVIPCSTGEIERFTAVQIGALMGAAALAGTAVRFVKPHGALGNLAAADRAAADAVAAAVAAVSRGLAVLAISGGELEGAARRRGLAVFSEIFADRAYLLNGRLAPREKPGAMIEDACEATARLLAFLESGLMPTLEGPAIKLAADSVCVHGDSRNAVAMARAVREALTMRGVAVRAFAAPP